jgi:hypothetical protein
VQCTEWGWDTRYGHGNKRLASKSVYLYRAHHEPDKWWAVPILSAPAKAVQSNFAEAFCTWWKAPQEECWISRCKRSYIDRWWFVQSWWPDEAARWRSIFKFRRFYVWLRVRVLTASKVVVLHPCEHIEEVLQKVLQFLVLKIFRVKTLCGVGFIPLIGFAVCASDLIADFTLEFYWFFCLEHEFSSSCCRFYFLSSKIGVLFLGILNTLLPLSGTTLRWMTCLLYHRFIAPMQRFDLLEGIITCR